MQVFVFAYGSLAAPDSLAGTIGRAPGSVRGPVLATLHGYAREWNVGSDQRSHPERVLLGDGGVPFVGTLAVLGVRADATSTCNGALYALEAAELAALDRRERNYHRQEVSALVSVGAGWFDAPVHTYIPRGEALDRLARARELGTAVVRAGYADAVEGAFDRLGPAELATYRRTTRPHRLPVRVITVR